MQKFAFQTSDILINTYHQMFPNCRHKVSDNTVLLAICGQSLVIWKVITHQELNNLYYTNPETELTGAMLNIIEFFPNEDFPIGSTVPSTFFYPKYPYRDNIHLNETAETN